MVLLERLHRCDYLGALSCLHEDEKEHVYRRGTPYGGEISGKEQHMEEHVEEERHRINKEEHHMKRYRVQSMVRISQTLRGRSTSGRSFDGRRKSVDRRRFGGRRRSIGG
jgi:hypothetical protein